MAINGLGAEKKAPERPVPSMPVLALPDIDTAAAAAFKRRQIVRAGSDAWRLIDKSQSFDAWKKIGAALAVGKAHTLDVTRANAAWGSAYSKVFSQWMQQHGFGKMLKSTRSHAIDMFENIDAIEQWRSTLTDRERRRLQGPQQNLRRWRRETQARTEIDKARAAMIAWAKFVSHAEALPRSEALPLWQTAHEQAAARIAVLLVQAVRAPLPMKIKKANALPAPR